MTLNLEQRRALEMLAPRLCPGVGVNAFDAAMLTNLVNAEVASLPPERLRAGGRSINVTAPRAAQRLEIGEPVRPDQDRRLAMIQLRRLTIPTLCP